MKKGIQVSLIKIERIGQRNEVAFTFTFSPNPLSVYTFPKANHPFSLILEDSMQMNVSWTYSNGKLTALGPFSFSIEGQNVMANFTFNKQYIEQESLFLNFTIESKNIELDYIEDPNRIVTFHGVMLGISCASLFLLLVGSFVHKMAGIEFIHCLQLIYYLHFTFKDYTITISSFHSLSFVGFNNLYWQAEHQNVEMMNEYQKIDFSVEYTELTIAFLAAPTLVALIGSIIYELMKHKCE